MREFLRKYLMDYTEKVDNRVMISLEDILDLLENDNQLRGRIYISYERECHEEDVREEIEYRNQMYRDECSEENKLPDTKEMIFLTEEELAQIVEDYEDNLDNDDSWHANLNVALDKFLNNKKENK